jgi:hypothetical protein
MAYAVINPDGNVDFRPGLPTLGEIQRICSQGFPRSFLEHMYLASPRASIYINDEGIRDGAVIALGPNAIVTRLMRDEYGHDTVMHGNAVVTGRGRSGETISLPIEMQDSIINAMADAA